MKLKNPLCPTCGLPAVGTVDLTPGVAKFSEWALSPENDVDYGGTTEMDWNSQFTVTERYRDPTSETDRPFVVCADGHEWPTELTETDE